MDIRLAGYNLDVETIESGAKGTPETISASYARISRDKRKISKLRDIARDDVEKARKTNDTVVFGMGHASIAEHSYFNFDIVGVSRLATERIQECRLASFTEKSQRYCKLSDDFVIPQEMTYLTDPDRKGAFSDLIKSQNATYHKLYKGLKKHLFKKFSEKVKTKEGRKSLHGMAKEDARYVVSLATQTQFGMSVNARSLENMIRKFLKDDLQEVRDIGHGLYAIVSDIAPSLVKYVHPDKNKKIDKPEICNWNLMDVDTAESVVLYDRTEFADATMGSVILDRYFDNDKHPTTEETTKAIKWMLSGRTKHEQVDRCFEMIDYTFDIILSASAYAQLKRHRMSSQIPYDYDLDLGVTVPQNIIDAGLEDMFMKSINETEKFYHDHRGHTYGVVGIEYCLTNAHRRRVRLKMNMRSLYHFMGLRLDTHAQWDIKSIATDMANIIREETPIAAMMLCGKHEYDEKYKEVFGEDINAD